MIKKFVESKNKNKGGKMERKKTIKKSANRGFRSKSEQSEKWDFNEVECRTKVPTDFAVARNRLCFYQIFLKNLLHASWA